MTARASWSSALTKRGNVCLYNKHLLPLEKGKIIYPTAVFLDSMHQKKYYIGANKASSPTAVFVLYKSTTEDLCFTKDGKKEAAQ